MSVEEGGPGAALDGELTSHLLCVHAIVQATSKREETSRSMRKRLRQRPRREVEQAVRMRAVQCRHFVILSGGTSAEAARGLGLSVRTLSHWEWRMKADGLSLQDRGRPLVRSSREERNRVVAGLELFGPGIGRSVCRRFWSDLPRSEVEDIATRYRKLYVREHSLIIHRLSWLRAGAVWAMDHATPPGAVDGSDGAVFAVRDLSSGYQLQWHSVEGATAQTSIRSLEELRREHGLPLVLKSDRGSAFTSEELKDYLREWGVIHLLSPAATPQYNGACEAAIGWMKQRTRYQAARSGGFPEWTSDDLEAARMLANRTPRLRSAGGRTPEEAWNTRAGISTEERMAFAERVAKERLSELRARGQQSLVRLTVLQRDDLERTAIRRALVAHGILQIRRREIPLPQKLLFRAKIS
jgi:transposase InsO family protein